MLKVFFLIVRYQEEGDLSTRPKTGRHRVTTAVQDQHMQNLSVEDPFKTAVEIHRQVGKI